MAHKSAGKAGKKVARKAAKSTSRKPAKKVIDLYGNWLSQPAQRVALMLSMAKAPHRYHHVDLQQGEHKTPAYRKISRFGQVPALTYKGEAFCQSSRILELLAEKLGKFDGGSAASRREVREWMSWIDDRLTNLRRARSLLRFNNGAPDAIAAAQKDGSAALDVLNGHLSGRKFIVGAKPTIADISAYCLVALADEGGVDTKGWPNVESWAGRMRALPGAGHPYDVIPKESRP